MMCEISGTVAPQEGGLATSSLGGHRKGANLVGLAVLGITMAACQPFSPLSAEADPPPFPGSKCKALSGSATQELATAFSDQEEKLGVVLVVGTKGNIKAFRSAEAHPVPLQFPLENEKVMGLGGVSLFILNPKVCWTTSDGDRECVRY